MTSRDDAVETRLRSVTSEADPPPEFVLQAGRAAFALRDLDSELAALVADSAVDATPVLTRAVLSDVRMLSFECGAVTVELDVESDPTSHLLHLSGIAVGAVGEVAVVRSTTRSLVALDDDGRFGADGVASGPLRLELTTPDGRRVTTAWVSI